MPDWLSAPPAAGTSVRTRGITERAGKNNAKEYFYEKNIKHITLFDSFFKFILFIWMF